MEPTSSSGESSITFQYQNRFVQYKPVVSQKSGVHREKEEKRITKRVEKSLSRQGRNVGKLKNLMKMPLDVFYEIVSHIEPLDLLQLSRVSTHFHDLLTTKNAKPYWRATRRLIQMPDCTPDLSEMQYISLVFERYCFACGVRSKSVSYALKVRFCAACWQSNVQKGKKVLKPYNDAQKNKKQFGQEFFALIISDEDVPDRGSLDYEKVLGQLQSNLDSRNHNLFYRGELEANYEEYRKVVDDETALTKFKEERKVVMEQALRFTCSLLKWKRAYSRKQHEDSEAKQNQARATKKENKAAIIEKLLALGYERTDFPSEYSYGRTWSKLLKFRGKLTDKYWDNTLFPKLKDLIEGRRKQIEESEFENRMLLRGSEFYSIFETIDLPSTSLVPTRGDCLYSSISFIPGFLAEEDAHLPVTAERVEGIMDKLMDFVDQFGKQIHEKLATQTLQSRTVAESTDNLTEVSLQFASTILTCNYRCRIVLPYSLVAEHIVAKHPPSKTGRGMWGVEPEAFQASYNSEASGLARRILNVAGLAPDATIEDVQGFEREAKLVCLCGNPAFTQPVTFVDLLNHVYNEVKWFKDLTKWEPGHALKDPHAADAIVAVLPDGESLDSLDIGNKLGSNLTSAVTDTMLCLLCPKSVRTGKLSQTEMVWHLNTKHGVKAEDSHIRVFQG